MSLRRRALFLAGLLAAVSCSDAGDPLGPEGRKPPIPEPGNVLQALDCTVTVSSRSLTCASAVPGTGAASGLIVGGQNLYVKLVSTGMAVIPGDTFAFNATVQNLIPQALGVDSAGAVDTAEGVRVFFQVGPTATEGPGPVVVGNADGSEVFISGSKPYFQYAGGLAPNATSAAKTWKLALNGATKFAFKVYVSARVRYPQGWIDITPDSLLLNVSQVGNVAAAIRDQVGRGLPDNVDWSTSNVAVATVSESTDSTAQVTGVAQGTAWIKAQSTAESVRRDSIKVVVNNAPVLVPDTIDAVANVTMPVDSANGMLANDSDDEPLTVTAETVATAKGGTATLAANGSLTYLSKPGFSGTDTIHYTVSDGARTLPGLAVVFVEDAGFWYVKAGSSGDGRDASPFGTLAAAQDSAGAGDTIFVLANGVQQVDGPVTLEADQALVGQGVGSSITRGTYNGAVLTVLSAAGAPGLTNTAAGATITLGTNNVIRGVGITAGAGAAIAGTSFGTLFVRESGVNPAGPALELNTGALDAVFSLLSSTGSATTGISLTDVTGSLASASGAIGGSVGTAFHVSGGSADITFGGSITNASGLAASIAGRTGGALTISGDVTDNAGGISVSGISGGTVGFSGALNLTGSGVSVGSNTGGSISFTGASKAIATGTNPGVSLTGNTGATVNFGGGELDVSTTSGAGFTASGGGTVSVTGAGNSITSTTGIALALDGVSTGTSGVSFVSIAADGAANGIALSGLTGAGVQVTGSGTTAGSGGTIQNTTSHAVSLASLAGADSVQLKYMTIGGGTGGTSGIFGGGFGTLRVAGVSVGTTGGPALSLATGTLNGTFSSLGSSNSATNGAVLTSTGGNFTAEAGSISNAAGTGFAIAGGTVTATIQGGISQGANNAALVAVSGGHGGTLTFNTGTLSATAGTGVSFSDADGTYAFNGTTTLNGGDAGVDVAGGSSGAISFGSGASIANASGIALHVANGGASTNVSYAGSITTSSATGLAVHVEGVSGGTVTASGSISGAKGIVVQNNTGGTITFSGAKLLNTGANTAVTLATNTGATVGFTNGNTDLTTTTGTAFSASGGGTVNVSGAGSDISTGTGSALTLNGVTLGASGMEFATVNTGAALAPVALTNVGVTTGSAITVAGGTIAAGNGARFAVSGGSVNVNWAGGISQSTHAAPLVSVTGLAGHTGTLAFSGSLSATSGNGLQFDNADGTYNFTGTAALNGGDAAIDVIGGSGGTFSFGGGVSVTNPTAELVRIINSAPTFTYSGSFSRTSGVGAGILAQSNTGGTITFNGDGTTLDGDPADVTKSLSTGTSAAISLLSNGGTTFNFAGGMALATTSGAGFSATGGATVQVTGSGNTVSSTTGTAVTLNGIGTGASGVTFRSVSANGAANGIAITNVTTGAGFQVTGNGGSCTVATPTCTGGTIQNTTGQGVALSSGGTVTLTRLQVLSAQSHGVHATGTTNLTLNSSLLRTNGNGDEENGLNLLNASGTVLVDATSFFGAAENLVRLDNTNANLTFTVQNASSFEFPNPKNSSFANSAVLITPKGNSAITANVSGNTFKNIPTYSFQIGPDATATATSSATFSSNNISVDAGLNVLCSSNSECRVGNVGAGGTGGTTNFVSTNNTFTRVNGDGVYIIGSNQSSTLRARVEGNSITDAIDDAFVIGLGQNARSYLQFNSNTISNIGGDGFEVAAGEADAAFGGDMDLVITNNSITNHSQNASLRFVGGIALFRFGDSDQEVCTAITGNTVTGTPAGFFDIYLEGNFGGMGGAIRYEGTGTGAVTDAKLKTDNPGITQANAYAGDTNLSNGVACTRPGI